MPTVQSSYADNIDQAVAGQIGNMVPATLISRTNEETTDIAFGIAVSQGTLDHGIVDFNNTDVVGITVRERSLDANTPDAYGADDTVRIMTKGCVWVLAAAAVDAGDAVDAITDGLLSNTGGVTIAGARWETSTTAGSQLALVRLG